MENEFKRYEDDPSNLLIDNNTDAKAWANSFMATIHRDKIDEEILITWFANAIENAKDSVKILDNEERMKKAEYITE